jgi:hypothetical protein
VKYAGFRVSGVVATGSQKVFSHRENRSSRNQKAGIVCLEGGSRCGTHGSRREKQSLHYLYHVKNKGPHLSAQPLTKLPLEEVSE